MQHTRNSLSHRCGTWSGFSLCVGWGAGRGRGEVGLRETGVKGGDGSGRGGGQQGAIGTADVALPHQRQVGGSVLLHRSQARAQVRGPRDGGEVCAEGVARRHQAPPGESVSAAAEGGVQALGSGGEGGAGVEAVLPVGLEGVWGGAEVVLRGAEAQEVGQHQVLFAQEAALVVGARALSAA